MKIHLRVISKPLIRSKRAQDAVVRLKHVAQVSTNTRQFLTLSYSLIEGEYEALHPPPHRLKSRCSKKKSKIKYKGSGDNPFEYTVSQVLEASDFNKNTCYINDPAILVPPKGVGGVFRCDRISTSPRVLYIRFLYIFLCKLLLNMHYVMMFAS